MKLQVVYITSKLRIRLLMRVVLLCAHWSLSPRRISVAYKESIREGSRPFLQEPCIYPANEHFKELFFTKRMYILSLWHGPLV